MKSKDDEEQRMADTAVQLERGQRSQWELEYEKGTNSAMAQGCQSLRKNFSSKNGVVFNCCFLSAVSVRTSSEMSSVGSGRFLSRSSQLIST